MGLKWAQNEFYVLQQVDALTLSNFLHKVASLLMFKFGKVVWTRFFFCVFLEKC